MRQNNITCFLAIAFSFLAIVSCNEVLDGEISSTDNAAPLAARSVAGTADYYYWYNGEKINISSMKDLYYISSPDSLSLETMQFKSKLLL